MKKITFTRRNGNESETIYTGLSAIFNLDSDWAWRVNDLITAEELDDETIEELKTIIDGDCDDICETYDVENLDYEDFEYLKETLESWGISPVYAANVERADDEKGSRVMYRVGYCAGKGKNYSCADIMKSEITAGSNWQHAIACEKFWATPIGTVKLYSEVRNNSIFGDEPEEDDERNYEILKKETIRKAKMMGVGENKLLFYRDEIPGNCEIIARWKDLHFWNARVRNRTTGKWDNNEIFDEAFYGIKNN